MLPVGIGSSGIDTGDIGHSLRFRSAANAYLNKAGAAGTSNRIATFFAFVKITPGQQTVMWGCGNSGGPDTSTFWRISTSGTVDLQVWSSGSQITNIVSSAVLRDIGWYALTLQIDTTQVSSSNRFRFWVNNNEITSFSTNTRQGQNTDAYTATYAQYIGKFDYAAVYSEGYKARVCRVDGTALDYTSFITFNSAINECVSKTQSEVKAVVDAGGTNSFMLDFDNGSSTTTLGYDKSSKGNNFTLSGHSLTAGVNYDWMLDVPGNSFPVINSLVPVNSTAPTISDANLKWTRASTAPGWTAASMPLPQTDKLYWETDHTSSLNGAPLWTGVVNSTRGAADDNANNIAGVQTDTTWNGRLTNGSTIATYLNPGGLNAVVAHAYDGATGKYWCGYVSGGSITWGTNGGVGDPAAGTNALETLSGVVTPAFGQFQTAGATRTITEYFNAGQRPFSASALPTGFKALCQANLSDTGTVTVSGSFAGNLNADGPCVWMNGVPKTLSINGNAVTFGTHADKLATGFKVRTASSSYNNSGSNTFTATIDSDLQNIFKYNNAEGNP